MRPVSSVFKKPVRITFYHEHQSEGRAKETALVDLTSVKVLAEMFRERSLAFRCYTATATGSDG